MKVYLVWRFDGIDHDSLYDIYNDVEAAKAKAKELNELEEKAAKERENYVKNEHYVDAWDVVEGYTKNI